MTDDELRGPDKKPLVGVENLMLKLASTLGGEAETRKGETMEEFFGPVVPSLKYCRKNGERITDWISRWDEGVRRMSDDGVKFLEQSDLAAWFFLRMSTLSPIRREMVLAKVPHGKDFD